MYCDKTSNFAVYTKYIVVYTKKKIESFACKDELVVKEFYERIIFSISPFLIVISSV